MPTQNEREKEKREGRGKSHFDNFKWNIIFCDHKTLEN